MSNQQVSTDLLYDYLADPNKLKPIKQTAQIIDNDDSENQESYVVDYNNDNNEIINETPKLNFNSENKYNYNSKISSSSSKEKSPKKKSSSSSSKKVNSSLKEKINNDLNVHNFSSESTQKAPTIKPIKQSSPEQKPNAFNKNINNIAYQKELKFKKMEAFTKLMHIKNMGMELTRKYTMESELDEMEAELKYHSDIQSKKNGVQLAKSFMCNALTGLEYLNDKYDPFGFNLKGWSDQVKLNKDDYDDVFGELLEKYKGNGKKMEPELKLAMMLMISAGSFHMAQSMTSNLPGLDDVIKNNPELMAKLQSNINKSISGPTELDKKKELYNNVKKLHDEKVKQTIPKPMQPQTPISQKPKTNPTSVKNLLNDIKKTLPNSSAIDSNSITLGDTVNSDSDSSNKPTISAGVKTKNKLGKKNIQFTNS